MSQEVLRNYDEPITDRNRLEAKAGTAGTRMRSESSAVSVSLDDIAHDPTKAAGLAAEEARRLLARCVVVQSALLASALAPAAQTEHGRDSLDILTPKDLAREWKKPEAKIRELCRSGAIPAIKLGPKEWVIPVGALRERLTKAPVAKGISPGLISAYDPGRGAQAPQAARPYTVEVRRPGGRSSHHGGRVGGRNEGDERHDRPAPAHPRAAGAGGAGTAAPAGDDSPTKGALT